ncbi:MAG TPA: sulfatase [Bryobacteraceae bacterium]
MKTEIARGALYGCAAWLAYGALEFALSVGSDLFGYPEAAIMPWQWPLIALTLAAYAGAGIALGALGGWLAAVFHRKKVEDARAMAILSLAFVYLLNLFLAWRYGQPDYVDTLAAAMLCLALGGVVFSDGWARRFGFLATPWGAGLLLLGGPWLMSQAIDQGMTRAVGVSLELACVCGVFLAMFAASRRRRGLGASPVRQLAGALAATGVLAALAAATRGDPSIPEIRSAPAAHPGTNIILITMDTVRADHLSLYGYGRDTTPHLREFARDATVYTRAVASSDFTLATHGSIFTGMYPEWDGATYGADGVPMSLDPGRRTLAEILQARSYSTAAIVANFGYLGPSWGLLRGFTAADWSRPVALSSAWRLFYLRESVRRLLRLVSWPNMVAGFDRPTRTAEDINRQAFRFLSRQRPGDAPFLLFLNYMDAHDPFVPAAPFDTRFEGWYPRINPRRYVGWLLQVNVDQKPLTTAERDNLVSQYDGGIAAEDAAIGELFRRLREMNLYDDALLIVMADHGESLGDRNLMSHSNTSVYQDQIHVPLIVKYPRQREGSRSDRLVSDVDLLPTVLDVLGSPCPADLQGQSLRSAADREEVFSYAIAHRFWAAANSRFKGVRRAIFSGSLKFISWSHGPSELYDLSADPDERRNLYAPDRREAAELSQRLDRWARSAPRRGPKPAAVDRSTIERLKTLGYAQ